MLLSLATGVTAIASIGEISCHGPRCVPAQRALFLREQWAVCQSHTCLLLQSFLLQIDSCASSKHGVRHQGIPECMTHVAMHLPDFRSERDEQPDPRGVRASVEPLGTSMLRLRIRFSRRCSSAWRQVSQRSSILRALFVQPSALPSTFPAYSLLLASAPACPCVTGMPRLRKRLFQLVQSVPSRFCSAWRHGRRSFASRLLPNSDYKSQL